MGLNLCMSIFVPGESFSLKEHGSVLNVVIIFIFEMEGWKKSFNLVKTSSQIIFLPKSFGRGFELL